MIGFDLLRLFFFYLSNGPSVSPIARSDSTARNRSVPGNSGDFMETVFQCRKIFGFFRWETVGSRRRILRSSGPEHCFRFPSISRSFLSETIIFPDLSCRFQLFRGVGIIVLGLIVNGISLQVN